MSVCVLACVCLHRVQSKVMLEFGDNIHLPLSNLGIILKRYVNFSAYYSENNCLLNTMQIMMNAFLILKISETKISKIFINHFPFGLS